MGLKEGAEAWKKVLAMLESVKVNPKNLKEIEELLSRIMSDLEKSINLGELPDPRPLYEQQSLAIKLESTLEDLRNRAEELEQLREKLKIMSRN